MQTATATQPSTPTPTTAGWLAAVAAVGVWFCVAHGVADDPRRTISLLALALGVFAFLPAAMSAAICVVLAVPIAVLGPIAAVARLVTRRPTGLRGLIADGLGVGLAVVPGYVGALRRVRRPVVWGFAAGSAAALPLLIATLPRVA